MPTIFTFGYEGHSIEEFCNLLRTYEIDLVIDVRRRPLDHKHPSFAKFNLIHVLQTQLPHTRYLFVRELGCSPEIHQLIHEELGYLKYFQSYERYLQRNELLVKELAKKTIDLNICLLCSEPNPKICHRTLIADYLQIHNYNSPIHHLI